MHSTKVARCVDGSSFYILDVSPKARRTQRSYEVDLILVHAYNSTIRCGALQYKPDGITIRSKKETTPSNHYSNRNARVVQAFIYKKSYT